MSKKILLLAVFLLAVTQCSITDPEIINATGTVKYIPLEGGFFGIVTDSNENLDPVNLSADFQKDGLKVSFSYKIKKDNISVHMWGKLIEIVDIKENRYPF